MGECRSDSNYVEELLDRLTVDIHYQWCVLLESHVSHALQSWLAFWFS